MENFASNLDAYKSITERSNVDLEILLFPYEYQLRNGKGSSILYPQSMLKKVITGKNIRNYDLSSALITGKASDKYYLYGDGIHLSALGHKVIAKYIISNKLL